jgi:diacylglycerol kinase family enzyme
MKVAIVLNMSAGTLMDMERDTAVATIASAFERQGATVTTAAVEARECHAAMERAVRSDADVVVVGGGDGTIATAANLLAPTGKALGVLPLGTMNLLARDLGIPLELPAAVDALAAGSIRPIDIAEVNGALFLNNSVLGIFPAMVRERERQRGQHHLRKWPAMAVAAAKALYRFPVLEVWIDLGAGPHPVRTPILAVSNGAYEEGHGPVIRRASLERGKLGVYVAHHRNAWGMLRLVARMGLGTWAEDDELDSMTATTVTVNSRRRRLRVANDGEVLRLKPPLVYRIRPGGLNVLTPRREDP